MDRVVVIGVGNPYRRDDGVGPAIIDLLRGNGLPDGVRLECSLGDTADLMDLWRGTDLAIVIDAARPRRTRPGAVHHAVSSHHLPMGEAVELARALDRMPRRLELYAIEAADTGHGQGLSPPVRAAARRTAAAIAAAIAVEVKGICALPIRPK
jgi:hydrogenase maturation protease